MKRRTPRRDDGQLDVFAAAAAEAEKARNAIESSERLERKGAKRFRLPPPSVRRTPAQIVAEAEGLAGETGRARASDPVTSKESSAKVKASKLHTMIVMELAECGRLATYQMGEHFNRKHNNVSPALKPLVLKGLVEEGGYIVNPETRCRNITWRLRTGDGPYCARCRLAGVADVADFCDDCTKAQGKRA